MGRKSPRDYIRLSCELHLDGAQVSGDDAKSQAAIEAFLQEQQDAAANASVRLFVWVPQSEEETAVASIRERQALAWDCAFHVPLDAAPTGMALIVTIFLRQQPTNFVL